MAVLLVKMAATVGVLLSVVFVSGDSAHCTEKNNLYITAPKEMEALSGSCLQIPCNFRPRPGEGFVNTTQIFGVWIKRDPAFGNKPEYVVFNSSKNTQKYPMNVTGNLNQQVCTTLFYNLNESYTDTYFFRVESQPFRGTGICDPLQITVRDSPPSPMIELSGELKEAGLLGITCSAPSPCPLSPPHLTWSDTESPQNQQENTDGTFRTKIQKNITLSDRHDGYSFTCSARYPVDGGRTFKMAESNQTLSVSYAPKETSASISPSGPVSAGTWVNLTCSSRAKPPVSSFTWFKESQAGDVNVSVGDFYTFNATAGGVYYCKATNDVGEQTSERICLSVSISSLDVQVIVKTLEIIVLVSILVAFECWFRFRFSTKPVKVSQIFIKEEEEDQST
ncbi:sialoadhesin-like isoform X1 [Echeneis naucrates]|uniref:sialoadhesin-like isoform X1 n=1 Tax=Echeneis naucrates TaxID=173247 RepID=UPI001113BF3C|nr:sialoadhesin-like isoform X1 [Echeneis naucrates]